MDYWTNIEKHVRLDAEPMQDMMPINLHSSESLVADEVNTQLRTMGMRVRKVIAGGYQITKKPTMPIYTHEQGHQVLPVNIQPTIAQRVDLAAANDKRQRNLDEFFTRKQ
ncbi:hypothetical protein BATDEDRAFT_84836 [Batrachochytrium dendrobatidis JAM81]|uniref:Uncharacterized protein n=2 Tax=Batrachochytrium dendrobatidis TaxID=109871 RepID=F4NVL4_BATDJ|nr:uncharacterized protein BATDEDRAFT_84836 [Batrachochytrium dendrobatidis JAM81]EGF83293.1 hypothetical protein BATDEDRAFT_84836 [Batrachochytrium dendrobatidis JAM81]KAJ8325480.1 hypothetical protein O5D80_005704 [Batrachochytrium dendrobatidis]KAK5671534.1 hypothetical protein QVD99_002237 [Batrachochytrium dendrobatidis]OAJ36642.1 hypothetical protein BDEG_20795 [Batrachochytrium dendrobatidis JEL423]|eukprot:XP_006676049.1 hypothetical protein BATDEDRAFT_84836 [Batrachochytrium dendrobatidis JAM81]